ncbi:hypothetical protein [Maricaulis maris]|uniref:Uncharacterized protein n=1 Tax=Maricaulis maris TaxID=74318 RepID=A0A495DLA6_9PROT|nr:hypothetical protein [Maricaulis maris]RKR03695.1 hypothetical protein C7435_0132 [Maricaulis maris]
MTLNIKSLGLGLALAAGLSGIAAAQPDLRSIPVYEAPVPVVLQAETLNSFPAVEAGQGAAVDDSHFYAIVNFAIGQYDRESGERVGGWIGPRRGLIGHLNSCFEEEGRLYCANSNHPEVPMASSVEVFETDGMTHVDSHSLGLMDEGSLTWFDHYRDGWIVGFAHYNDETGEPFKSNAYGGVHTFDAQWRRTGGWRLPPALIERMAPQAASGGAIGSDGLLYVFGHHVPELYVLARPAMGPALLHVATIELEAEGQAFAFDPADDRVIWAISRPNREVRAIRLPEVSLTDPDARRFDD